MLNRGRRKRLKKGSAVHFPGDTLFDSLARTVCEAECLPRKELYEAWETARRARRYFRGGRVVDLACGHGLAAWVMLLLDHRIESALAVDQILPPSAEKLHQVLSARWPKLGEKISYQQGDLAEVELKPTDVVLSVHACGKLTDIILEKAVQHRSKVVVVPCCHALGKLSTGGFEGWMEPDLAIDSFRASKLQAENYVVKTHTISSEITPKNRILLGWPED